MVYFCTDMTKRISVLCLVCCMLLAGGFLGKVKAQAMVLPATLQKGNTEGQDTLPIVNLREVIIFPPLVFKNKRAEAKYYKLVRDVKRTLPYAKMVYTTLLETYEYMETLPDEDARTAHLKQLEKDVFKEYKPVLKKLTLSQGKLLIKLINRECKQSSFDLLKAFLGSFRAGFWNFFSSIFGASLKTEYEPYGKDSQLERVVVLVENGLL